MKTTLFSIRNKFFTALAMLLFFNSGFSQERYSEKLNIIFQTFITKDFRLLRPIVKVSDSLTFDHTTEVLLSQQICLLPAPESYMVIDTETIGYNQRVTVEYQYADKARLHYFTFNPKGILIGLQVIPDKKSSSIKYSSLY